MGEIMPTKAHIDAKTISRFKKERALLSMSEDDFRDLVVRPLMLRMGLTDGRDLCGPDEEGKDCVFFNSDPIKKRIMYAVQTKCGKVNMTRKATENVTEALVQLRTALQTYVTVLSPKEKRKPDYVILCASGKINKTAREHIEKEIDDTRIVFMGGDEIINELDEHYPEYWYGIEADKFPYYRKLKELLVNQSEAISVSDVVGADSGVCPIADDSFVQLYLNRMTTIEKKVGGHTETEPHVEELPIQAVLKKPERLVLITGDAGSGKSTSLRRLAYAICEKALTEGAATDIPVMIKCTELEKCPHRLIELAAETTAKLTPGGDACFNASDLSKGHVLILLDALDEVANDESRSSILKKIQDFHRENEKCLVIITSRNNSFVKEIKELAVFAPFQLSAFSMEQAAKLVTRIVRTKSLSAVDMQETLRRIKDVHGVELNPLLVTIFVAISDYNREDIPANITELFKKYTEMMLGRWDKQKGLAQQIHAPIKDFLLRSLAFAMHQKGETSMPVKECRAMFERELVSRDHKANVEPLFEEIVYRSGLVRVVGEDIEFRHFLLQEFFAGRAIPSVDFLTSVVSTFWWTKAVVFYFGENPDQSQTIVELIGHLPSTTPLGLYTTATALGLAVQACYLSKVDEKIKVFEWVVRTLAGVKNDYVNSAHSALDKKFPELWLFINYYIGGRDAVASGLMEGLAKRLFDTEPATEAERPIHEAVVFWCLIGLIEIGKLELAEEMVKKYKTSDPRHLLGIHLGCYLLSNLRITSSAKKDVARRISARLITKIRPLMFKLLDDFKSMLLERRGGKIEAIPDTSSKELLSEDGEVRP